eukprot:Colp12_sorted_trinity150504_noHs@1748
MRSTSKGFQSDSLLAWALEAILTCLPWLCGYTGRLRGGDVHKHVVATREVHNVPGLGKGAGNFLRGIDLTELNETLASLLKGLGNHLGSLGITLSADDVGKLLLLGLLDNEAGTLSLLLGNLLLLDGLSELTTEGEVGNGHIIKSNVELVGTTDQSITTALGDEVSLCDELTSIKLSHHGLEDFHTNGGEHTLIEVLTKLGVNTCKLADAGAVEDTECNAHVLEILATSDGGNVAGLSAHVKNDGALKPGDTEVSALTNDLSLHTLKAIENDGTVTSLNIVKRGLCNTSNSRNGNTELADAFEKTGSHFELFHLL